MADYATKSDIKELKGLISEQTGVILNAVDEKLGMFKADVSERFDKIEIRLDRVEDAIRQLTLTLDEFMKRVIHQDEEVAVLNAKVDKISAFLKQKFGVEISAQ